MRGAFASNVCPRGRVRAWQSLEKSSTNCFHIILPAYNKSRLAIYSRYYTIAQLLYGPCPFFTISTIHYIIVLSRNNKTGDSGVYFVNDDCIGCSICSEIATHNFRFNHELGCGYVAKQPDTEKEKSLCVEVKDICPVSAIEISGEP
jgi:ferredoxin